MAFEAMHSETTHLLHLVDDLRQATALDSGKLPLERHPIAVPDLITDAIARIAPVAAAKGVRVSQEIPDELPTINLDAERIGQALFNLLENSVRHTPKGGSITLRAHCSESQLAFYVTDNGEGIRCEHLPHIFERFYRADPVRNRASGGSGLGLSIVQTIVEAHGGQVSAQSDGVGHGSTFTIQLPID
jgi:signal transduction histidine kinase